MSDSPILDRHVIATLRELTAPGEPDVLTEVLRIFLKDAPLRLERLRHAVAEGNVEEVSRSAHSLKGSAGNIGAKALYDVCKQLDDKGRAKDLSAAVPIVDALTVEFGKVESEIQRLIGPQ